MDLKEKGISSKFQNTEKCIIMLQFFMPKLF